MYTVTFVPPASRCHFGPIRDVSHKALRNVNIHQGTSLRGAPHRSVRSLYHGTTSVVPSGPNPFLFAMRLYQGTTSVVPSRTSSSEHTSVICRRCAFLVYR